ncbi:MAG: hypothetical protein AAGB46_01470 [Verrucomicrobiota bacterium]
MNMRNCVNKTLNRFGVAAGCLVVLSALSVTVDAKRKARVYVDSYATEEYVAKKDGAEGPVFETYHFFKGRYFGGFIADKSLDKVEFQDVVETLAEFMQVRNYFPARDRTDGDLLIVVHWGVTGVEEDWDELMGITSYDSGVGDFGPGDGGGGEFGPDASAPAGAAFDSGGGFEGYNNDNSSRSVASNARLLGFSKALNKRGLSPSEEYELRMELQDERYFIILMAYDWQHLQSEKEFKLQWSTRFSLNSIGTNFVEAHHTLSRAAMTHFGTNLEDLESERTFHGEGKIEHGELEIIGTEEVPDRNK